MRSEQLEYVAAVARLGSFRGASEELHISQPALSTTVRNLGRELGVTVLERGRSGAQLSDEGRELLPLIVSATEAIDRLRRAADEQHNISRMVRVGTVNAATVPLVTSTIAAFRELHPTTQVEVVGAQEAAIDAPLREGSFDLASSPAWPATICRPISRRPSCSRGAQVRKLERLFFDPRVQRYLATTTDPHLRDQLSPVSKTNG